MKKYYLLFALLVYCFTNAQTVTIPDPNFKTALLNHLPTIDTNSNGEIEVGEALNVTELDVNGPSIASMVGIEAFANLIHLECASLFQLTSLDVSNLTNLQSLNASNCHNLSLLNTTGLISLQTLNLQSCNALSSINVSDLINLQSFDCSLCSQLTSLNLSSNTNLTYVDCSSCHQLNSLNVSGLTSLQTLGCYACNLPSLDVSNLTSLNHLTCSNNSLTSLITSGATNITFLNCSSNMLTSLSVVNMTNLTTLICNHQVNNFSGIGGISNIDLTGLTNLTTLNCNGNLLNSLDVSDLNNLTYLDFGSNSIATIDLTNLTQLDILYCPNNNLSTLDVSTLTNLDELHCDGNELNALNIDPLIQLTSLFCYDNNLSSLNVSNNINLETLYCGQNQLTNLDLNNLGYLTRLFLNNNLFTTIDASNIGSEVDQSSTIANYYFGNNPNLVSVNIKNGLYSGVTGISINNCPSLLHICTDEVNIPSILNSLQNSGISTTQVNSYCSFVPGGIHNTINGTITIDIDNNGCDATDYHPNDLKVTINDGINSGATFSNNGNYSFYTQSGSFALTPQFQNPYFTVSPSIATLNFPNLDGSNQTQNFCITPNGIHNDIDVTLLPITTARPGFDATYQLIYKNKGNQMLSGTVTLNFDDAVLDFVLASPNVDAQTTNVLSWNYINLLPFESRTIQLTLNVNAPTETPAVNINDVLAFSSSISPLSGDETAEDNIFNLNQIVIGSFDPNDKTCLEGTTIPPTKVGDYLHYLIRFQNSGTAAAENIVVKDMIDTTKFDLASIQLTATSHPQVTRITGNKVEFIFENIQLPAEQDNEPASHGYIAFKIRTKSNLVIGNTVSNTADIYFDYNFPIITNTATTTIVALGVDEFENTSVVMTPNPVKDSLTITADDMITSIQMYDVQGRLITTQLNNTTTFNLNMNQQNLGIYFVKVITEKGVKVEKIIKK